MDRKWRTNRAAINTVLSFPAFRDLVTPLEPTYNLATITDLYSVYTVLHIENKQWEVQWSPEGQLYYFLAKQTVAKPGEVQQAAAPEGDEDMPPVRIHHLHINTYCTFISNFSVFFLACLLCSQ